MSKHQENDVAAAHQLIKAEEWVPGGVPLPGETTLAFACYCVYRDMGSGRSLRAASEQKVNGKKRSLAQWGKWSSQYDWTMRVAAWDANVAQQAAIAVVEQEAQQVEDFIKQDIEFAQLVRETCKRGLVGMNGEIDAKEVRNLTAAYGEARGWLSETLEVFIDGDEEA